MHAALEGQLADLALPCQVVDEDLRDVGGADLHGDLRAVGRGAREPESAVANVERLEASRLVDERERKPLIRNRRPSEIDQRAARR
jgi:hypothetical protein